MPLRAVRWYCHLIVPCDFYFLLGGSVGTITDKAAVNQVLHYWNSCGFVLVYVFLGGTLN